MIDIYILRNVGNRIHGKKVAQSKLRTPCSSGVNGTSSDRRGGPRIVVVRIATAGPSPVKYEQLRRYFV